MQQQGDTTWRVAAIMREPLAEVLRFCAWYVALGAQEVVICFDDPEDPAIALLDPHPRIRCVPCTDAFWREAGVGPGDGFVIRQNAALSRIYQDYASGWLLNVDADEFLFLEGRSIADLLASVSPQVRSLRVVTAERLLVERDAPGLCRFRRPMENSVRKAVYGEDARLFGPRRFGLVGHPQGKSLVRCGIEGLKLRQHWPRGGGGADAQEWLINHQEGAHLLHMIGADYDIWREKLPWRCHSRGFTAGLTQAVEAALAQPDPDVALRDLFDRLHRAPPALLERLQEADALLTLRMDLDALVRETFWVDPKALPRTGGLADKTTGFGGDTPLRVQDAPRDQGAAGGQA